MPQKEMVNSSAAQPAKAEQKIYASVYDVLLAGMVVSNVLFVLGLVLALMHPHFVPLTRQYVARNYHVASVLHGLIALRPSAIMMVATLLLILTPVARVLISVYAFYAGRDHKYVVVTGAVFFVIVLTVLLGWLGLK